MAGVLLIMQAMLVEVAPKLNSGVACSWKPCARMRARATSGCNSARPTNPAVAIGSYPMFALVLATARDPWQLVAPERIWGVMSSNLFGRANKTEGLCQSG